MPFSKPPSLVPPARFVEPPWHAPLDAKAIVGAVPPDATITGMFILPLVQEAQRRGIVLPSARARYVPFTFYPLREHCKVLIEGCELLFPELPLRQALRKIGRGAPVALLKSTLGRVLLGSAKGVGPCVEAMAKAYALNMRPAVVTVGEISPSSAVVRLDDIHYFLDCHHVGTFEGLLKLAGVKGTVRIAPAGRTTADFLLEWTA
jgi:uncharacterized protein (TIGR02265 family)